MSSCHNDTNLRLDIVNTFVELLVDILAIPRISIFRIQLVKSIMRVIFDRVEKMKNAREVCKQLYLVVNNVENEFTATVHSQSFIEPAVIALGAVACTRPPWFEIERVQHMTTVGTTKVLLARVSAQLLKL